GHRLTGSDNYVDATLWAKKEFEKMGLSNVHLEKWDTWPVVWNRGQWQGRVLTPAPMELHIATPAWTAGTKGIVQGRLVLAPKNQAELDLIKDKIEGAFLYKEPIPRAGRGGRGRRGRGGRGQQRPEPTEEERKAAERAAEMAAAIRDFQRGPLAEFVEAHPIAGWVESSSGDQNNPNRIRVFGSRTMNAEKLPTIPEIVVRRDQAQEIVKMLKAGEEVTMEFDIRNRFRAEPVELNNVIAEIPGTEKPGEVVIVCGHLDSWHQATGTTDNGTGVTSAMETARILAAVGARPKRTIRFMLWGGEEQGLLGSRGYVQRHRTDMPNVSAVLNHDSGTNWAHRLRVNTPNYEALKLVMEPVMSMTPPDPDHEGDVFVLSHAETISGGGGSDHASFIAARVPAFSWGLTGRSDYFGYTWHSQWDTYDAAIPEYQRHNATVFALASLGIANLPEKLSSEGIEPSRGRRGGNVKPMIEGFLGIDLGGQNDLEVTKVNAGGTAAKAGLKKGDVITAVNDEKVASLLEVVQKMRDSGMTSAAFTVKRGEESVQVQLGGS
ncbi:MAG: M20/M25/M40 family metallo-hydrolase, partial [Planctomycetota bacterium]